MTGIMLCLAVEATVMFMFGAALCVEDAISKKNGKPNFFQRHGWE